MKAAALICLTFTALIQTRADWRDDAGFPQLQAELGAALPNGAGISVMMAEAAVAASEDPPQYLPQATAGVLPFPGMGVFSGKTIIPHSGASPASGHAESVAARFCSSTLSVTPGVTDLHVWWADHFAGTLLYSNPIPTFAGSVQNHSWVGGSPDDAVNLEFIRRFDFMVDRDAVVAMTPLNNGASMARFLANAYHGISAGRLDGGHPHTHSNLDVNGRMKPDIVVNEAFTSMASPAVASVATLLLDAIRPDYPDADDPRVVKAIMLSAASKQNLPGWRRQNTSRPYDEVHGAGQLNLLHAYHILAGARQTPSTTEKRPLLGWDRGVSDEIQPARYFFTLLPGEWGTISATITWHRSISEDYSTSSLADLNLHLRHASGFTAGAVVDESNSTIDNVEHLFRRHLPPGDYVMEVSSNMSDVVYGLAWEVQANSGPQLTLQREGAQVTLLLSQLDPLQTYTVEHTEDLIHWQPLTTFRTADIIPSTAASHQETVGSGPKFYRLFWTP